jgi:hypothetical protein
MLLFALADKAIPLQVRIGGPIPPPNLGKPQITRSAMGPFFGTTDGADFRRFIPKLLLVKSANLRNLWISSVDHRHRADGRAVGAFDGQW